MANSDAVNDALRARLQTVLNMHSQAEVARRTGHSLSNVNRYATGTRMPASFVAALVSELGVSPAWLLTGKGEPHSADISGKAEERATDLLEIVQAMSAVTQMRLGSLTTRHHLKVLKELNEALTRHEALQTRLNQHSRELFAQMMDDLGNALDNLDLDRAERLLESASQVAKLCDDFELNYQFYGHQARIEFGKGHPENAGELMRKQFLFALMRTGRMAQRDLDNITRFALSVASQHRVQEGVRVMRSGLALLAGEQLDWPGAAYTEFLVGHFTGLQGELHAGLAAMQRHFPRVGPEARRAICETYLANAMLYSGLIDVEGAIRFGGHSESKAKWIMDFCVVMEDLPGLERATQYYDSPEIVPVKGQKGRTQASRTVLKALQGQGDEALAEWGEFHQTLKSEDVTQLHWRIVNEQVLRIAGRWEQAAQQALQTQQRLDALDPEISIGMLFEARHYHGLLQCAAQGRPIPPELIDRARAWIQRHIQGGYTAFARWLQ